MGVDIKAGNAVANTVAQNLQAIDKTLDVAGSGSQQAANLAAVQGAVFGNSDIVESIGSSGVSALTSDFAKVTNDMIGANAASGGNVSAYQADMAKLTSDLNNAGVQFDTSIGQGHYDSTTVQSASPTSSTQSGGTSPAGVAPTVSSATSSGSSASTGSASPALRIVTDYTALVDLQVNQNQSKYLSSNTTVAAQEEKYTSDLYLAIEALPATNTHQLRQDVIAIESTVVNSSGSASQALSQFHADLASTLSSGSNS